MHRNPSSCGGEGKKCPPKALTDKVEVSLEGLGTNNQNSGQYLGIKPKPTMSKKMRMSQQIRSLRGGR